MTNSGCRRWLWLGLALGATSAAAQGTPAPPVCGAPPALLEVRVGGSDRGAVPVLRLGDETWIPGSVLTGSEQGYAAAQAQCRGVGYVRLSPALDIRYDDEEQTLTVRPALGLLPGNVLDFAARPPEGELPLTPLYAVTARVQASGQLGVADAEPSRRRASLGARYALGRWDLGAGVTGQGSGGEPLSVTGQVQAGYRFSPTWGLRAVLSSALLAPADAAPLPNDLAFSGVELSGRSGRGIVLPQFTLDLPLDSEVTLAIDDQVLRQFRARAGTLVVRNLPLPRQQGELLIFTRDSSGARRQVLPFQNLSATLGQNDYQVYARVGAASGRRVADLSAYYGLGPRLVLRLLGTARGPGVPSASLAGLYATPAGQFRAGVGVQASPEPGVPEGVATLGYGLSRGRWTAGVDATVPLADPGRSEVQASAGYAAGWLDLGLAARSAPAGSGWNVGASATARLTKDVQLTGQATSGGAGWRAGLGVIWTPSDRLSAAAGVASPLPPGPGEVEPTFSVSYQATPDTALSLSADRTGAAVDLQYDGPVSVSARVGTNRGYALDASASVVFTRGGARVTPEVSPAGLLVRTGVPGLALTLDGAQRQVTDRRGDALFFGLTPGETGVVAVDFGGLDFGTQVTEDSRAVVAAGAGLGVLDWTQNFRQVRWLQVFWSPGVPAAHAALTGWPGESSPPVTDDQGNVQLTRTGETRAVDLTGEDGRTCRLVVSPGRPSATCPAAP